ncbi:purine-binding chemotaxis protein CheW [Colwellia chukchiensis]|uniref:Purine-binding chemotaxis protein CheW n=1 Tax=Colwellia chukchiensis TaxID=641665 RepID=A0A1H7HF59_9GAMM|nr:chemotaxis protein CheW [Colwellia chukchiensis]SEK48072.1 purine-binding chemotaxis protein CheW [Colwellia chukchiensis]
MSKSLAASKQLMQTYLSELLTEEASEPQTTALKAAEQKPLDKLLASASVLQVEKQQAEPKTIVKPASSTQLTQTPAQAKAKQRVAKQTTAKVSTTAVTSAEQTELKTRKSQGGFSQLKQRSYRQGDFQAMFFEVAGLMIAVPLIELGGIVSYQQATPLMGKPDWFKGVMLNRENKINVVDSARWVMPEKCDDKLLAQLNYQYVILLSDSLWGLSAENLVDTVTLKQDEVKWLDSASKRPWLAGLVKNRMCALLDVKSLIALLEKGVNAKHNC